MKNLKSTIILLFIGVAFSLSAQSIGDYRDVVHFKNGSSIEGIIIEQIPGESIKIKANDGKVYSFPVEEVSRFTRELAQNENKGNLEETTKNPQTSPNTIEDKQKIKWGDNFKQKPKGYFVEADLLLNTTAQGLRVTNGYKFGRFGMLGVAIGLEKVLTDYWKGTDVPELTLNLVYSGDILNKRITPYYQVEAGYGFALKRKTRDNSFHMYDSETDSYYSPNETLKFGGPMGAITLGVKFKTKRKIVYKLGLDARIVSQFSENNKFYYDFNNELIPYKDETFTANPGLGFRFGIGF